MRTIMKNIIEGKVILCNVINARYSMKYQIYHVHFTHFNALLLGFTSHKRPYVICYFDGIVYATTLIVVQFYCFVANVNPLFKSKLKYLYLHTSS